VRLALESGKPKTHITRELNISEGLLYSWISRYDEAKSRGQSPEAYELEKDKMRRLKADNNRLQEEVEILKKASAYFAKHLK